MPRNAALLVALAASCITGGATAGAPPVSGPPTAPAPAPEPLTLGSIAPDLAADVVWLMGMPVGKFEAGKVYAVLLWTPGEAPSLGVLPMFDQACTRLRSESVYFVSVALSSNDPTAPAAQDYVLGKREYFKHAASQDRDEAVRTKWLHASGRERTPLAFVVDDQRRIAFIGDPMLGMEETIQSIVDGSFDMETARSEAARLALVEEQAAPFIAAANAAAVKRDWAGVLDNVEKVLAIDAEHYYKLTMTKFYITLARLQRPGDAYPFGYSIVDGAIRNDHAMLTAMADIIVNQPGVAYRDYNLARLAGTRADELTQGASPTVHTLLAAAYFEMGDLPTAVDRQRRAVGLVNDPEQKRKMEEVLARYESALTGQPVPPPAPAPEPAPGAQPGHDGHDHPHAP